MPRRTAVLTALGPLTLSLALVACAAETAAPTLTPGGTVAGAAEDTGQTEAEARACDAIQAWSDEMNTLAEMDITTASAEDVQAQLDEIGGAWDEVRSSLAEVEAADEQAVMDAGEELETAIDEAQTDIPIADVIEDVQSAAQPLQSVYQEMADGIGCTLENPY